MSLFDGEPEPAPKKTRKKYPPRFAHRPVRIDHEEPDRFMRVCPGCLRPLRWMHYSKLLRMDPPKPTNDLEDIVWVPELREYLVPRYMDVAMPHCAKDGPVDWWLIRDTQRDLLVGVASDHPTFWPLRFDPDEKKWLHPEGGKLFRSPKRTTALLSKRLLASRSCRYAGRWRMNQRNNLKPLVVGPGRQADLW